jgi:hypothetical protein
MRAYISKQVKMHAYHLNFETLDNEFCKFHMRKIPTESIKWKANLKWPKIKIAVEIFLFLRIYQPGQAAHEK